MSLITQVVETLKVDESKAEKGIGTILLTVRAMTDSATFGKVKQAVPEAESTMGRSLMSGGSPVRTGELSALVGPGALMAGLTAAGYSKDQMPVLAQVVFDAIREATGPAVIERLLEQAPFLKS